MVEENGNAMDCVTRLTRLLSRDRTPDDNWARKLLAY